MRQESLGGIWVLITTTPKSTYLFPAWEMVQDAK